MTNKTDCNCSLSIRLCGDGCKKCQPETYIFNLENALQAAEQEIEQLRSEIESIKKVPMFDHATHKIVPINPTYEMVTAWHDSVFNYEDDDENVAKSISNVIAAAPEYQESSQWVSVNERLPEIDTPVLAVVGKNVYALARVEYEEGWLWGIGGNDLSDARNYEADDDYQPTHWMYLSIPPALKGDKPCNTI